MGTSTSSSPLALDPSSFDATHLRLCPEVMDCSTTIALAGLDPTKINRLVGRGALLTKGRVSFPDTLCAVLWKIRNLLRLLPTSSLQPVSNLLRPCYAPLSDSVERITERQRLTRGTSPSLSNTVRMGPRFLTSPVLLSLNPHLDAVRVTITEPVLRSALHRRTTLM